MSDLRFARFVTSLLAFLVTRPPCPHDIQHTNNEDSHTTHPASPTYNKWNMLFHNFPIIVKQANSPLMFYYMGVEVHWFKMVLNKRVFYHISLSCCKTLQVHKLLFILIRYLIYRGQNRGILSFFEETLYGELISLSCTRDYFERWVKFLGPPLTLERILGSKIEYYKCTLHPLSFIPD